MQPFSHFAGIDWTGAKGKRHPGLKVAVCESGDMAPKLVTPPSNSKNWSRQEFTNWIACGLGLPASARCLVGVDAAFGYPFIETGGYLRGDVEGQNAYELWAEIAHACDGAEDLFGGPFVERHAKHYRHQQYNAERRAFDTIVDKEYFEPSLRIAEQICINEKYGPCESVFNLIGASQVGKSALSTINMLHQLKGNSNIAIWPFDDAADAPIVLVEIYAAIFSKLGGGKGKVRDIGTLNECLASLGSKPYGGTLPSGNTVDDVTDAIMTSAGLRLIAEQPEYWRPKQLSTKVRETEGWIFGIR